MVEFITVTAKKIARNYLFINFFSEGNTNDYLMVSRAAKCYE